MRGGSRPEHCNRWSQGAGAVPLEVRGSLRCLRGPPELVLVLETLLRAPREMRFVN